MASDLDLQNGKAEAEVGSWSWEANSLFFVVRSSLRSSVKAGGRLELTGVSYGNWPLRVVLDLTVFLSFF